MRTRHLVLGMVAGAALLTGVDDGDACSLQVNRYFNSRPAVIWDQPVCAYTGGHCAEYVGCGHRCVIGGGAPTCGPLQDSPFP